MQFPLPPAQLFKHSDGSRQLCGSCLDLPKADGWAGSCCRPPGSEEAALFLRPGHRQRQMNRLSPQSPLGRHPQQRSSSGQPPSRGLSKGQHSSSSPQRVIYPHHTVPWSLRVQDPATVPTPPKYTTVPHTHSSSTPKHNCYLLSTSRYMVPTLP